MRSCITVCTKQSITASTRVTGNVYRKQESLIFPNDCRGAWDSLMIISSCWSKTKCYRKRRKNLFLDTSKWHFLPPETRRQLLSSGCTPLDDHHVLTLHFGLTFVSAITMTLESIFFVFFVVIYQMMKKQSVTEGSFTNYCYPESSRRHHVLRLDFLDGCFCCKKDLILTVSFFDVSQKDHQTQINERTRCYTSIAQD